MLLSVNGMPQSYDVIPERTDLRDHAARSSSSRRAIAFDPWLVDRRNDGDAVVGPTGFCTYGVEQRLRRSRLVRDHQDVAHLSLCT